MNNAYYTNSLMRIRDDANSMLQYQQQPMNVFNMGTQCDFEARIITKDDNPKDMFIQRKTAFICFENALLTIKEINGDIKEYPIELPKSPEQIENEELKKRIQELEKEIKKKNE